MPMKTMKLIEMEAVVTPADHTAFIIASGFEVVEVIDKISKLQRQLSSRRFFQKLLYMLIKLLISRIPKTTSAMM